MNPARATGRWLMIDQMGPNLGANARLIVENRAGASGTIATAWLARPPADGYSLIISESSSFAIWPRMHESGTRYRPLADDRPDGTQPWRKCEADCRESRRRERHDRHRVARAPAGRRLLPHHLGVFVICDLAAHA